MHNFRFRLLHPLILKICFDSNFWRIFVIRNHCASLAVLPLLTQLLLHFTQVWLACYSLFFFTKGKDLLLFTIVTNELVVELQGGLSMICFLPPVAMTLKTPDWVIIDTNSGLSCLEITQKERTCYSSPLLLMS